MNHKVLAEGVMEDDWDNATFILNVCECECPEYPNLSWGSSANDISLTYGA